MTHAFGRNSFKFTLISFAEDYMVQGTETFGSKNWWTRKHQWHIYLTVLFWRVQNCDRPFGFNGIFVRAVRISLIDFCIARRKIDNVIQTCAYLCSVYTYVTNSQQEKSIWKSWLRNFSVLLTDAGDVDICALITFLLVAGITRGGDRGKCRCRLGKGLDRWGLSIPVLLVDGH